MGRAGRTYCFAGRHILGGTGTAGGSATTQRVLILSKVLPINFGSSDEATEATVFVLSLDGVAGAAAVQVAVLALLAARHVEKTGRKPVLFEAARILAEDADIITLIDERFLAIASSDVTKATRGYVRSGTQTLMLESPAALRAAVDNAATALLREHLKRSSEGAVALVGTDGPRDATDELEVPLAASVADAVHEVRGSYVQ